MSREQVTTDRAPSPGGPYSQGMRSGRGGRMVATAGQVGVDPATGELVGPDIASQTRQALANTEAILAAAGASWGDVIRIAVYLASMGDFQEMNEVYRDVVPEPRPVRTTVGVALGSGVRIEVDALAVVD